MRAPSTRSLNRPILSSGMDGSSRNSGSRSPQTNSKRMTLISTRARSEFTFFAPPALADLWAQRGFDGVAALLAESGAAPTIGQYAALCITDSTGRIDFLLRCLALRGDLEQKADACMLGFLWSVDAAPRPALLLAAAEHVDADQRVRLFNVSPFEKLTWLIVDAYGTDVSTRYWKEVFPQWSRRHSDSDLNELVDRLLDGRPRAAFHAAHMDWARLETSRLKRLLTDVATVGAEAQGTYRLDAHHVSEALERSTAAPA